MTFASLNTCNDIRVVKYIQAKTKGLIVRDIYYKVPLKMVVLPDPFRGMGLHEDPTVRPSPGRDGSVRNRTILAANEYAKLIWLS